MWAEFIRQAMASCEETFDFRQRRGISLLSEGLLASQGLCFMERLAYNITRIIIVIIIKNWSAMHWLTENVVIYLSAPV